MVRLCDGNLPVTIGYPKIAASLWRKKVIKLSIRCGKQTCWDCSESIRGEYQGVKIVRLKGGVDASGSTKLAVIGKRGKESSVKTIGSFRIDQAESAGQRYEH